MHIFYGAKDGRFSQPQIIEGTNGKPLIMVSEDDPSPGGDQQVKSAPFPVDLNGDGLLDLVSGNAAGTFAYFPATEKGKFSPQPIWLTGPDGTKLRTRAGDSGPTFIDWDQDGDMDLLSGSGGSGVFLFKNIGTKQLPQFDTIRTLISLPSFKSQQASSEDDDEDKLQDHILGSDHIKTPNVSWRVTVTDFNQDGKLDILVGDRQFFNRRNEDLSKEEAAQKLAKWQPKYKAINTDNTALEQLDFENEENWTALEKKAWSDYTTASDKLDAEFASFAQERETGFIWLYLQK